MSVDDRKQYHTGLERSQIGNAEFAILPGDPGRVPELAKALDTSARAIHMHREYNSWVVIVDSVPVLVCSTGIGGPSTAIAVEELAQLGVKNFIRVGTTGSIQKNIEFGDIVISLAAVRLDGASTHYAPIEYPAVASLWLTNALGQCS
ncbi:Uridine phosphorylase [mine drainage metagenome]|uniref:Uridine phosphorylase n=1 Tax=mine drainage metagenome TaxID=410659 RepID=T0ZLR5_9ZZZZ